MDAKLYVLGERVYSWKPSRAFFVCEVETVRNVHARTLQLPTVSCVSTIDVSADGTQVVLTCEGAVQVFAIDDAEVARETRCFTCMTAFHAKFTPENNIAIGRPGIGVEEWAGEVLHVYATERPSAFDLNGKCLAIGTYDGKLEVFDRWTKLPRASFALHIHSYVQDVRLYDDTHVAIVHGRPGAVPELRVYDIVSQGFSVLTLQPWFRSNEAVAYPLRPVITSFTLTDDKQFVTARYRQGVFLHGADPNADGARTSVDILKPLWVVWKANRLWVLAEDARVYVFI